MGNARVYRVYYLTSKGDLLHTFLLKRLPLARARSANESIGGLYRRAEFRPVALIASVFLLYRSSGVFSWSALPRGPGVSEVSAETAGPTLCFRHRADFYRASRGEIATGSLPGSRTNGQPRRPEWRPFATGSQRAAPARRPRISRAQMRRR